MYQDQDSIKVFERMHARDRLKDLARTIGRNSPGDLDVFGAHAGIEDAESRSGIILSIVAVAVLVGAFIVFFS